MRVPTIFTAVDKFSNVVDKMTRKTTMFSNAAGAAAMRTSTKFNQAGTTMLTTGTIMGAGIGVAVNEAMKFEKAMSNVSTTIDSTPALMKQMGDGVLALSKKIPIPLEQLTSGLYDVVSAGIEAKYGMTVLGSSGRLAVAGLGTAAQGVDLLTSSINAFNIDATKSDMIANMVFKAVKYGKTTVEGLSESFGNSAALIKNSNVELSEFLATTATLTTTGMSASRAQTQVASATIALIKPNKSMSKIYSRLGVKDVPTFIKKSGGLVKTLDLVVNAAKATGVTLPAAFGRKEGLNATLSLLGSLRGKYEEINKDMISGGDTLTEAFKKQNATSAARFQLLKNNLVDLAIKIGNAVLPALNSIMGTLSPILSNFTDWAQRNQWLSKTILYTTVTLLSLGAAAKVAAAIFYGYGTILKTITFFQTAYTTVTELCTVATYLAASGQATFAASLWAVAAGMFAAYAPIILVVGALGLLGYAAMNAGSSTDGYVNKQISGLDRSNMAWKNSTSVMKGELNKQSSAMAQVNPINPNANQNSKMASLKSFVGNQNGKYAAATAENNAAKAAGQTSYSDAGLKAALRTNSYGFTDPANAAKYNAGGKPYSGKPEEYTPDMSAMAKKFGGGEITIHLESGDQKITNVENSNPSGIKVITSTTKEIKRWLQQLQLT